MSSARKTAPKAPVYQHEPLPPLEPIIVTPSEDFKIALLAELRRMEDAHRAARRVPSHTMHRALIGQVEDALKALAIEGRVKIGPTINDHYILIRRPEEEEEQEAANVQPSNQ